MDTTQNGKLVCQEFSETECKLACQEFMKLSNNGAADIYWYVLFLRQYNCLASIG